VDIPIAGGKIACHLALGLAGGVVHGSVVVSAGLIEPRLYEMACR
jgi:hypothetical protein